MIDFAHHCLKYTVHALGFSYVKTIEFGNIWFLEFPARLLKPELERGTSAFSFKESQKNKKTNNRKAWSSSAILVAWLTVMLSCIMCTVTFYDAIIT
jgi:hypothetical protein